MADAGERTHSSSASRNAEGAADFAGMDGEAEPGIAGDVEGAGIVGNAAHALLAGHIEAGDQRIIGLSRHIRARRFDAFRAEMPHRRRRSAGIRCRFSPSPRRCRRPMPAMIGVGTEADALAVVGRNDEFAVDRT